MSTVSGRTDRYLDGATLMPLIRQWANELGFQSVAVSDIELSEDEARLFEWLDDGWHGEMKYMARHGTKRSRPAHLVPGTVRVLSARMNYLPQRARPMESVLADSTYAYVSRYALGRDYHKVLRRRLQRLADHIEARVGSFGYRAFCDSAPVLEKALGRKAGLGWVGKHTNLLSRTDGSWFFLGELYTNLPLPVDSTVSAHCGSCGACIDACPTQAIVAPYRLDARRCISYLTIEHPGSIPVEFRALIGNRIYGCDDCQLVCPWNREAPTTVESDFEPRHALDRSELVELFRWEEPEFLAKTEGSAIRRIGYERWLRNIAVALGNAPHSAHVVAALHARSSHSSTLVREHVSWALAQHRAGNGQ